ncbi:MAG: hypothetical protein JWP75_4161 [Frondihabitans sp.]|nr:hypothetical protein [Frondihabitans sp.]
MVRLISIPGDKDNGSESTGDSDIPHRGAYPRSISATTAERETRGLAT